MLFTIPAMSRTVYVARQRGMNSLKSFMFGCSGLPPTCARDPPTLLHLVAGASQKHLPENYVE